MNNEATVPIHTVTIAGEICEFHAPTFGELVEIIPAVLPVLEAFMSPQERNLPSSFFTHGDNLSRAIALATGKPVSWLDGLGLDDFLELFREFMDAYGRHLAEYSMPRLCLAKPGN